MKFRYEFIQNKHKEFNDKLLKIMNMDDTNRINFLNNKGCRYSFEYIYGIKYENIISNADNLMELSYYYMFHNFFQRAYNLQEFYTKLTKAYKLDRFYINQGIIILKPIIKKYIENEEKEYFKFQDINKKMIGKNNVYLEIVNRDEFLKCASENTKMSIINTAKTILEQLSLYESDPLTYISNNNINLLTLFVEEVEIYELEHHDF